MGFGSGMIIDPEGYILTADFVVADAEDIEVILPDRREFKGELKGMDRRFGVAVIKIDAKGLALVKVKFLKMVTKHHLLLHYCQIS